MSHVFHQRSPPSLLNPPPDQKAAPSMAEPMDTEICVERSLHIDSKVGIEAVAIESMANGRSRSSSAGHLAWLAP